MFEILILGAIAAVFFNKKSVNTFPAIPPQQPTAPAASATATISPVQTPTPEPEAAATITTIFEATEADLQKKPAASATATISPVQTPAPEPEAAAIITTIFEATEADLQKKEDFIYKQPDVKDASVSDVKNMAPEEQKKFYWDSDFLNSVQPLQLQDNEYYPYLFLWTTNRHPYNGWGFVDMEVNGLNIPDFRKARIQAFLYWFFSIHEVMPLKEALQLIHGSRNNMMINTKLSKYCLDNGINLEKEIWNFEKAGGFSNIELLQEPPLEIGFGATTIQTDFLNRTGWMIFGIDYPRDLKAKYAAFEIELAFQKGTVSNFINQYSRPIYEIYDEIKSQLNLTPLYGRELTHINRTLTPTFKKPEAFFVEDLLKVFPDQNTLSTFAINNNLFNSSFKEYQAQKKRLGEAEGHNAYFKAISPENWMYVYKDTKDARAERTAESNRIIAEAELIKAQKLLDYEQSLTSQAKGNLIADDILELINSQLNWYFLLPNTSPYINGKYYDQPNERIHRYIKKFVNPTFGNNQKIYANWLKANGKTFWNELKAWEAAGNPFTPSRMLSVDSQTGLLTRESQSADYFPLVEPTQTDWKIGRIYKTDPSKVYITDATGTNLYTPVYDGYNWTRYQLTTDAKGTFYPIKNIQS